MMGYLQVKLFFLSAHAKIDSEGEIMNTRSKLPIFLILLLTIAIIGIWVAYGVYYVPSARISATYMEVYQEVDPAETRVINISNINHKLIIKRSEGEKVRINYFQKVDNINTYNVNDGTVTLKMAERVENLENLFFQSNRKIDTITISVPEGCAITITNDTVSGTVTAEDLSFTSLSATTLMGTIDIKNSTINNLTINTNEGNVNVTGVVFDKLHAISVSGTVSVDITDSLMNDYVSNMSSTYGILKINGERVHDTVDEKDTVVNYFVNQPEGLTREITISGARSTLNINSVEPAVEPEPEVEPGGEIEPLPEQENG